MKRYEDFLRKTECCFHWGLQEFEIWRDDKITCGVEYFKDKLEHVVSAESSEDPHGNWPLRLVYAYELFATDPHGAAKEADGVVSEIEALKDAFTLKYQVPFLHIVHATRAVMLLRSGSGDLNTLKTLVGHIKPKSDMSDAELSGLLAMKAHMMRLYGPDGTHKSVPLLEQAIRMNPREVEWPLSLVVSKTRIRHYIRGRLSMKDIQDVVEILDRLLHHPDITPQQKITCKYYKAVAYNDVQRYPEEVLRLCNEISQQSEHPGILSFCAQRFDSKGGDKEKSKEIIEKALKKFPEHVGVNTTACKIYKHGNQYALAAKYAKTAMENGGYGTAWLLLECRDKLGEDFDDEEFFNQLLFSFQALYTKQTHVGASVYYFCKKRDDVKGAYHMEQAIKEDPKFKGIHEERFNPLVGKKIRPIELAYNRITRRLQTSTPRRDEVLLRVKRAIEDAAGSGVRRFNTVAHW